MKANDDLAEKNLSQNLYRLSDTTYDYILAPTLPRPRFEEKLLMTNYLLKINNFSSLLFIFSFNNFIWIFF